MATRFVGLMDAMNAKPRPAWPSLLLLLAAVALSIPLVLGLFGAVHPAFDSFAHFRLHLAAAMGMLALPLLATVLWREALMVLALAAGMVAMTLSAGSTDAQATEAGDPADMTFTLMQFNTRFDNRQPKALIRLLAREAPDIVTLQEVSSGMRGWLERVRGTYPYQHYCDSGRVVGGAAILSKRPWTRGMEPACAEGGYMALARVNLAGTAVDVAAIHLRWPWPHSQPAQIARIEPVLATLGPNSVIAGDFNATPWSAAMRRIAAASDAVLASPGATWLLPSAPQALRRTVGLPIDHVLLKGVTMREPPVRLEDAGSDHLPVLARFTAPVTENQEQDENRAVVRATPRKTGMRRPA